MKKNILSAAVLIFSLLIMNMSLNSQVKVQFKLAYPQYDTVGIFSFILQAVIPTGQVWHVGSSNIRIDFFTIPAGRLTVHPDNSTNGGVRIANPNLNNNTNYDWMTTTSISGGTAISLNIVLKSSATAYTLNPGTYTLGRVRFNRVAPLTDSVCTTDTIRHSGTGVSVVYDGNTLLTTAQWGVLNPPPCTFVGIATEENKIPQVFKLHDNYPNPFNPATTIKYDLPKAALVKIVIYDMLGKEVDVLVNEQKQPGYYEVQWNASNYASGTYFYKLETSLGNSAIKKMVLVK